MNKIYADSMGFLDLPGKPPIADINLIQPEIGANINLIHLTAAPPWLKTTEEVLSSHREFVMTLEKQKIFKIIRTKNDLKPFTDGTNSFTVGCVLGLQNTPHDVLENDNLQKLYNEGIRIMAIAYEEANVFGGGYMAPKESLTAKGLELLSAFEKSGIILDISHAGLKTAWNIIRFKDYGFYNLSIFASHSGCYDQYMHNRNITNEIISGIVKHGGLIGIPTLDFILSKDDNTLNSFMNHVKHAVNFVGEDAVCVGSDGVYKQFWTEQLKAHHKIMLKNLEHKDEWGVRFPEHPLNTYTPRKMEIIEERLSDFFSQKVTDKICGRNFAGFLERSLPDD